MDVGESRLPAKPLLAAARGVVGRWSVEQVAVAVAAEGGKAFEPYAQLLRDENVSGATFLEHYSAEQAWKDLPVTNGTHIARLIKLHGRLASLLPACLLD